MTKPLAAIVEWLSTDDFMISSILPEATRIQIYPDNRLLKCQTDLSKFNLIVLHINATCQDLFFPDRPEFRTWAKRQGIALVNARVGSIDKWRLQDRWIADGLPGVRAPVDGDPDERLVVKARANHSGKSEALMADKFLGDIARIENWPFPQRIAVAPRSKISPGIWSHYGLTVERYVENPADRYHRAYVLGNYVAAATAQSAAVMKEMDHRVRIEFRSTFDGPGLAVSDEDPLSVAYRSARSLEADFAAIDIAEDADGRLYPIDLNVVPWWGPDSNECLITELREACAALLPA